MSIPLPVDARAGSLPAETRGFLEKSYPSNHTYRMAHARLIPKRQLAVRYRRIVQLYPEPLTSLLDLSCCKGFFVFGAAARSQCQRAVGIDVNDQFLDVCRGVQRQARFPGVRFEHLLLHEVVARIDEFGGLFQTVLLVNMYPYLFFGSSFDPYAYLDHREIFRLVRLVCSQRVVFANRTDLDDLAPDTQVLARESDRRENYRTEAVLTAANEFFRVRAHGTSGRRALLTLDAR